MTSELKLCSPAKIWQAMLAVNPIAGDKMTKDSATLEKVLIHNALGKDHANNDQKNGTR